MIKVLHINLSPLGKGGIERLLVDFFRYFRGQDIQHQFCILNGHNEISRGLLHEGCVIDSMNRATDGFDWRLYGRLYLHLKSCRPDIVHIHGNPGLMFGVPAALCAGINKIVYTCHFSRSGHSKLRHRVLGMLLNRTSACIAVSRAARDVLVADYHQRAERIQVIYNGVDIAKWASAIHADRGNKLTVGFCGVFRPEKQIPILIRSFASLLKAGNAAKLLLIGDGPEMQVCREVVANCGIHADVEFAGSQSDVQPFLRRIDVFVLPSREEAMPVALLEAMSQGCAAVGSNVGGIPEVIQHDVSGVLIPSGDEGALSAALLRLASDPALRARYGRLARLRVEERFSLTAMMESYAELYRGLISNSIILKASLT
jgi:glycosyltransferase involved in cell wall biosynthesis